VGIAGLLGVTKDRLRKDRRQGQARAQIGLVWATQSREASDWVAGSSTPAASIRRVQMSLGRPILTARNFEGAAMSLNEERLVKSKRRVADHGEVFTPAWMVENMLDLVKEESERIDSRVLEPACGSGNFLVAVLARKLATVHARHGKSDFEKRHYALFALMCTYGIELLADNSRECRNNLATVFNSFLDIEDDDDWAQAARAVLSVNIVQGDALTMTVPSGRSITFPEWAYLGKGKYQRRDFRYEDLTQRASYEGTLFGQLDDDDLFVPIKTYPPMTVHQMAERVRAA
jgi:hypothetical protein